MIPLQREQEAPKPTLLNAAEYYYDRYSEQDESRFLIEKIIWRGIKQNNSSDKTLTDKELEYTSLINGILKNSPEAVEYFSKDFLCARLNICDRQLRRIRKNTSHIFKTKWRKKVRTYRGKLEHVYAIRPTEHTVFLLKETAYYKSVKVGHQCPSSIYKYEKNIKDIDLQSNFLQNSKNENQEEISTAKIINFPTRIKKHLLNQRRKPTNSETKAKVIRFNQRRNWYPEPKTLAEHYPLSQEDCTQLQSKSGREFSLNAMNEILLDMSKRLDRRSESKTEFIAYFGKCLMYEMRDAVKTANENFRIRANITEEERNYAERERQREKFLSADECKADDLENRTTDGFQRLLMLGILDKLIN